LPLAQGFESTDTWLSIAIKIVKAHLKSYIISSSADQAAIVLYGTVRLAHVLWKMLTLFIGVKLTPATTTAISQRRHAFCRAKSQTSRNLTTSISFRTWMRAAHAACASSISSLVCSRAGGVGCACNLLSSGHAHNYVLHLPGSIPSVHFHRRQIRH